MDMNLSKLQEIVEDRGAWAETCTSFSLFSESHLRRIVNTQIIVRVYVYIYISHALLSLRKALGEIFSMGFFIVCSYSSVPRNKNPFQEVSSYKNSLSLKWKDEKVTQQS